MKGFGNIHHVLLVSVVLLCGTAWSDNQSDAIVTQPDMAVVPLQSKSSSASPVVRYKVPRGWFWNRLSHWWYANQGQDTPISCVHGKVLRVLDGPQGAIVEQVAIYPKLHAQSQETMSRKGILVRYKGAQATVLMCHGFMCDKYDVGVLRNIFEPGKYNVMTFDFRAHGEDVHGQSCSFGMHESQDVIAAARFLKQHPHLKDKPLYVYGFSMGAAASIEAQSQQRLFDAMVLDCPFDSSENVIRRGLDSLKITFWGYEFDLPGKAYLQKYAFNPYVQSFVKTALRTIAHWDTRNVETNICPFSPAESAKKVDVPCFFIHCKNDEKVPVDAGKSVYEAVTGYKKMWVTNGRRHFDSYFYNPEKYAHHIRDFLDRAQQGVFQKINTTELIEDPEYELRGA